MNRPHSEDQEVPCSDWRRYTALRLLGATRPAPALIFTAFFFGVPFALLILYSFYTQGFLSVEPAFDLSSYRSGLTDPLYLNVLLRTILVGLGATGLILLIAYPFTMIATFVFPRRTHLLILAVVVSLFAGYLARIYAYRTLLGDHGILNSVLLDVGILHKPLIFLLYSRFAVGVVYINIYLPFAILPLAASMQNVARDVREAARDLGAGRLVTFRTIVLPLTSRGARAAFILCFLLTAGDYVTPTLVGGPTGIMMGNVIEEQFGAGLNWPLGCALTVITIASFVLVIILFDQVLRRLVR